MEPIGLSYQLLETRVHFRHAKRSVLVWVAGGDSVTTEYCFTNGRHSPFEAGLSRPGHRPEGEAVTET